MIFNISFLNNREIAILFWLVVFFIWASLSKDVRASMFQVLKIFFSPKIISSVIAMIINVSLIIFIFYKVELWNSSLIKDTIYWFLGTAFILLMNTNKANQDEQYFRKVLLENLTFIIGLEFIINLYSFSLIVELFLIPIVTFIAMMVTFVEINEEYAQVKKILYFVSGIIGIYLLLFAFSNIISNFSSFANINNLRVFLLPPALTFAFLPFIYFFALLMAYENVFIHLRFGPNKNKKLIRTTKQKIFKTCYFNLRKLNKFSKKHAIYLKNINNGKDALDLIQQFEAETASK